MAQGFGITGTIIGLKETLETLRLLPGKLQRRILRPALTKATKPILMAAKRLAPTDTGMLSKSIARKVVTYKSGTLVVVIGPDTKHRVEATRRGRKTPMIVNPAKYAHLVEFGTRPHSLGKDDTLARTGEQAKASAARAVANIKRWTQQMINATEEQQAKLQKRIAKTQRWQSISKEEKQTVGAKQHRGAKAKPFLRKSFDSTRDQVQAIFAAEVKKNIDKLAAKGLIQRA